MERTHGRVGWVWVMDRGIAAGENVAFLRERGATYVVGTPQSKLLRVNQHLTGAGWATVEPGIQAKCCPGPDGTETFVLCRSQERRVKEQATYARFARRIGAGLTKLARRVAAQRGPDRAKIEHQIGRLLGRNAQAAGLFGV